MLNVTPLDVGALSVIHHFVLILPQPGLPLGFLFSVKGIGWSWAVGRFPRDGPPVPPAPAAGSPGSGSRFPRHGVIALLLHFYC